MEAKSKVRKYSEERKIVEIPKSVRDNFEDKEEVLITKVKNKLGGK